MTKSRINYICQQCDHISPRWQGQCPQCQSWNSLVEQTSHPAAMGSNRRIHAETLRFHRIGESVQSVDRWLSGIGELDRVLGGGIVPGSAVLVGGEPGVGKSTLLLQAADRYTKVGYEVLYISGEESSEQIRLRASRLGLQESSVQLAAGNDASAVSKVIWDSNPQTVVIVDSIQTLAMPSIDAPPGTVSQIRASAAEVIRAAKEKNIPVILVGHVTKEGSLAGPKILEHAVDVVLQFEGERGVHHRIIRASKNRYGATDEIGVFEMTDTGLSEVENPSEIFLSSNRGGVAGCAVMPMIEGTRPILVEVQALVSSASYGTPRRAVVGWDNARLAMMLAVLDARCNINFSELDVHLNIVGGLKVQETAADLAVCAALASARFNVVLPEDAIYFGEIGLAGEVRPVGMQEIRLREAYKLGFQSAICPTLRKRPEGIIASPMQRLLPLINRLRQQAQPANKNMAT